MSDITMEQWARDIMEECGDELAQTRSAGDVVQLANLLNELEALRAAARNFIRRVDEGSVRSKVTYASFITALAINART